MKTVVVTGGASALGLESGLYLAERGFNVYAAIRDLRKADEIREAAEKRHVVMRTCQLDVTDGDSIDSAIAQVVSEAGGIYGLVNNAAVGLRGCFEDLDDDEIRRVFEVNVFGTMAVTRRVLPHLRQAGSGRILTVTSVGGRVASFGLSAYCATKFGLEGFGEALALEVAPFGLKSILIEPGIINTPYWTVNRGTGRNALNPDSPYHAYFQRHEEIADRIAARSRTRTIEVARAVHHALTAKNPRMRYVIGRPASIIIALRRYIPGELFDRLYFGLLVRSLTPRRGLVRWLGPQRQA